MMTNQEFFELLENQYFNIDWDNLPDLDLAPDVYVINGKRTYNNSWKVPFSVATEYPTREEAENQIDYMKQADVWGGVLWDTLEIKAQKPRCIVDLHIMKALKDDVLAGTLTMPLNLP